ncbi:hypothetical protein ACRDNQ_03895 [Palleronia sp. KMU-117]|uniref:hypothetical protein n=1 Tax=Palleronia sp. KMU-117 TaxID=3434108 RepID=UPI003D7041EA
MFDEKPNLPLDESFNEAVLVIAGKLVPQYVVSDDAPGTFRALKEHLDAGKTLVVAAAGSDYTVFGTPEVNWAFRAWHDWVHWRFEYDFSLPGEAATCSKQIEHLYTYFPGSPHLERWSRLLVAEVIGQRQYYERHRAYVDDQRAFAVAYIANGPAILGQRW